MNIIARLEYELAYYDSAVHRFNHYTTRTPHQLFVFTVALYMTYMTGIFLVGGICFWLYNCISWRSVLYYYIYIYAYDQAIGLMSWVFVRGPGDQVSIPGWVIPKTQKLVLDAVLLNTQIYKVRIKGKLEQSSKWSSALPNTLV